MREFESLTLLGSCSGSHSTLPVTSGQCWSLVLPTEVGLRLRRWGAVAKRTRVAVAPSPLEMGTSCNQQRYPRLAGQFFLILDVFSAIPTMKLWCSGYSYSRVH